MKKVELIVKKVENEKSKFFAYTHIDEKTKKWYKVKFVKNCQAPEHHKVEDGIIRAFIGLDVSEDKFNIQEEERVFNEREVTDNIMYVESYTTLDEKTTEEMIEVAKNKILKYREKQEQAKKDFCESKNDEDLPF